MTLQEIKDALKAGLKVHWSNPSYSVELGADGEYVIACTNGHRIGLTWMDGETLNGKPEEFYVTATDFAEQLFADYKKVEADIRAKFNKVSAVEFDFLTSSGAGMFEGEDEPLILCDESEFDSFVPSMWMQNKYDGAQFLLHVFKAKDGRVFGRHDDSGEDDWYDMDNADYPRDIINLIAKMEYGRSVKG